MKRLSFFMFVLILLFLMTGCNSNNSKYNFKSQGIEISFSADTSLNISFEDSEPTSTITFFDNESVDYKGSISISLTEDDSSLEELYDLYLSGNGEKKQTIINENLIFVDSYSTYPTSGKPNNWYYFILYDNELQVVLFGRFSAYNNQRDIILSLAKSVHLKKSERISPYPDDYSRIIPKISVLSSNEEVTEYCTILKSWKNKEYDLPAYQELLKDKKVYLLSGYEDNIVFADGEYKSTTVNATTDLNESSLFYEGASGFRISRPSYADSEEFYVFLSAEYGNSGELTYVFKCKFQQKN